MLCLRYDQGKLVSFKPPSMSTVYILYTVPPNRFVYGEQPKPLTYTALHPHELVGDSLVLIARSDRRRAARHGRRNRLGARRVPKWVQTVTDRVMLFLEEGQAVTDENVRDVERMLT